MDADGKSGTVSLDELKVFKGFNPRALADKSTMVIQLTNVIRTSVNFYV